MQKVKVSDIAKQIRGVSYKPNDLHSDLNENSVILLRANNIDNGKINFDDIIYVDKSKVSKDQYLQNGDILICASSGSKNLVGKSASVLFDKSCTFGAFCKVIRPQKNYSDYLGMYFQSEIYRIKISKVALGANINNIRNEHIDSLELPIYSESIQQDIVSNLNKVTHLIDLCNAILEKLDLLVMARFVEMFGKINKIQTISNVCSIITDGTHQSPQFTQSGIPFLFVSNIITNEITYNAEKFISEDTYNELYKRTPIEIGDIILSTVGSYGHPAIVKSDKKFLFQRHIAYLKPIKGIINSTYLHSAILSEKVQKQIEDKVKGVAQKTLNLSEIRKIAVLVPPIVLQEQFAEFVKQTDKSKLAVKQVLEKAEMLKKALMQEYFG